MNKTTNIVIGVLSAIALVVGVVAYNKTPTTIVGSAGQQGPQGIQGERGLTGPQGPQGIQGPRGADGRSTQVLGSVSSPDIMSPYFSYGGVRHWAYRIPMTTAVSSTTCQFQSPNATTTAIQASARFTTVASTSIAEMGISSNVMSTTTLLSATGVPVTAGLQSYLTASTTAELMAIPPNSYIALKVGAGSVAGQSQKYDGFCQAVLIEI